MRPATGQQLKYLEHLLKKNFGDRYNTPLKEFRGVDNIVQLGKQRASKLIHTLKNSENSGHVGRKSRVVVKRWKEFMIKNY